MKIRTLTQVEKPHDINQLHDAFVAAGIPPLKVEGNDTESRFAFQDAVTDGAIQAVITAYTIAAPPALVDIKAAWQAYETAVNNATTVPQIKAALTDRLGVLLKELLKVREANL